MQASGKYFTALAAKTLLRIDSVCCLCVCSLCVCVFVFAHCSYELEDAAAGFVARATYRTVIESFKIDRQLFCLFSISLAKRS